MQACCNLNDSSLINLCHFPNVIGFAVGKLQVLKAPLANMFGGMQYSCSKSVSSPLCSKPCCLFTANKLKAIAFCQTFLLKHAAVLEFSIGWE